jgi:hypothetical protein
MFRCIKTVWTLIGTIKYACFRQTSWPAQFVAILIYFSIKYACFRDTLYICRKLYIYIYMTYAGDLYFWNLLPGKEIYYASLGITRFKIQGLNYLRISRWFVWFVVALDPGANARPREELSWIWNKQNPTIKTQYIFSGNIFYPCTDNGDAQSLLSAL